MLSSKILTIISLINCLDFNSPISNIPGLDKFNEKNVIDPNAITARMTYSRFLEYIDMGWVEQVDFFENGRVAIVKASNPEIGNRGQAIRVDIPIGATQLIEKLKDFDIDFDAHPIAQSSLFLVIIANVLLPIIFITGLILLFQNSEGFQSDSNSSPLNVNNSPARYDPNPDTGVSFNDIAGIDEAKSEFEEIVSFIKDAEKYRRVGARTPKGVLLVGPPGTGKTLLAKAIATEAGVPFFDVAGSEFVEMFIGIGAARIRDLFTRAAENTPCIIFIDEIDAVGRERGSGIGGGNDEREQTLNQLLTEMDGFSANDDIIVVGATNRSDILDAALIRPGRFDRQITVGLPDRLGRIEILKVHARNKPIDESVSLAKLASRTPNFSGAELANILNEAALLATRELKDKITNIHVDEAADRIIGGIAGSELDDTKEKRLIAYYEVGHALVGTLLPFHDDIEKITLKPRGNKKGLTWFVPQEDQTLISHRELLDRITGTFAGRITEEMVFGIPEVSTNGSQDLYKSTRFARSMVTRYGMSHLGPIAFEDESGVRRYGDEIAEKIDKETFAILRYCENRAMKIIYNHRPVIDLLVDHLLDGDTLEGDTFRKLVQKYTNLPVKKPIFDYD